MYSNAILSEYNLHKTRGWQPAPFLYEISDSSVRILIMHVLHYAGPSGRAVKGVVLRLPACWDCEFVSSRVHRCLSLMSVECCLVEVSVTK